MLPFSNPRLRAEFDDWPSGSHRVKCVFAVEKGSRGYRVSRTTQDKYGKWCKPKLTTYGGPVAIVDGSDGRTYLIQASLYGGITVWSSDFMCANLPGKNSAGIYKESNSELYETLLAMIKETK